MFRSIWTAIYMACAASVAATTQTGEPEEGDPLYGKTMNIIGDSYAANHKRPESETWHAKVAMRHGMKYNNYGKNGNCVAFDRSKEHFGRSMLQRYGAMKDSADIIIIIAGHNDASYVAQSSDTLQMFGESLDSLLTGLKEKYPNAKIGYVTPWYVDRPGFKQTVKMIRRVCRKHGVPVLDNYRKSSIIKVREEEFRKKYFQGANDMAHLNNAGHDLFLPTGEAFLTKLMAR